MSYEIVDLVDTVSGVNASGVIMNKPKLMWNNVTVVFIHLRKNAFGNIICEMVVFLIYAPSLLLLCCMQYFMSYVAISSGTATSNIQMP